MDWDDIKNKVKVTEGVGGGGDGRFFMATGDMGTRNPMIGTVAEVDLRHPAAIQKSQTMAENEKLFVAFENWTFKNNKMVIENIEAKAKTDRSIDYYLYANRLCLAINWPGGIEIQPGHQWMIEVTGRKFNKAGTGSYFTVDCRNLTENFETQEVPTAAHRGDR